MSDRLAVTWPDPRPFVGRAAGRLRLLAVSDEEDSSLESARTRVSIGHVDLLVGCGDLEPAYLSFLADAFDAPLHFIRGNHDVGAAWAATECEMLPDPMPDASPVREEGLTLLGFSGSPRYRGNRRGDDEQQVTGLGMWWRVIRSVPRVDGNRPVLLVTHAAPRGLNDAPDHAHRGFAAFRWLADRLGPPLWLHGHTSLVRRGVDARTVRYGPTLLVNVTGATIIDLVPSAT